MATHLKIKGQHAVTVHIGEYSETKHPGDIVSKEELADYVVEAYENGDPYTKQLFEDASASEVKEYEKQVAKAAGDAAYLDHGGASHYEVAAGAPGEGLEPVGQPNDVDLEARPLQATPEIVHAKAMKETAEGLAATAAEIHEVGKVLPEHGETDPHGAAKIEKEDDKKQADENKQDDFDGTVEDFEGKVADLSDEELAKYAEKDSRSTLRDAAEKEQQKRADEKGNNDSGKPEIV